MPVYATLVTELLFVCEGELCVTNNYAGKTAFRVANLIADSRRTVHSQNAESKSAFTRPTVSYCDVSESGRVQRLSPV